MNWQHGRSERLPGQKASLRGGEGGFTLLEILFALAIAGLVLVGLNTFIFSMGELWGKNSDQRLFNQHVNAVTRFLQDEFRAATLPPSARALATPITPEQITPLNGIAGPMLTFDLIAGSRVFVWPDTPLPEVTCSLQQRPNEGLFLLWHSRLETQYANDPPREVLLTPLVAEMDYDYYNAGTKAWTTTTLFNNDASGNPLAPNRVRLKFVYGKLVRWTTVPLPVAHTGLPNF